MPEITAFRKGRKACKGVNPRQTGVEGRYPPWPGLQVCGKQPLTQVGAVLPRLPCSFRHQPRNPRDSLLLQGVQVYGECQTCQAGLGLVVVLTAGDVLWVPNVG